MNFFFRNNCLLAVAFDWLVFLILSVLFHSTNMRSSMRFLTFLLSTDLTRLTALSIVAVFRKNEISKKKPRANNQKQGPRERMKGANKKCGLFFYSKRQQNNQTLPRDLLSRLPARFHTVCTVKAAAHSRSLHSFFLGGHHENSNNTRASSMITYYFDSKFEYLGFEKLTTKPGD